MIEFDNVTKTYPDGTVAVGGVSFEVSNNTTTVLLGTSGSGKTTLMRMVNRMVTPTSGIVRLDGQDVQHLDPVKLRRSMGYVLQEGGLFPHWKVADNVLTVPVLEGATKKAARTRANELLELVGLDPALGNRYPAQLSGGQRQRVGVARALANNPKVLLMDEPFGALDPLVRADLQRELRQLKTQIEATILFVTHDIDEALSLGDQVVLLKKGGMIAQRGAPLDIMQNPADDFVRQFLGITGRRQLHLAPGADGAALVLDEFGRPLGRLGDSAWTG